MSIFVLWELWGSRYGGSTGKGAFNDGQIACVGDGEADATRADTRW